MPPLCCRAPPTCRSRAWSRAHELKIRRSCPQKNLPAKGPTNGGSGVEVGAISRQQWRTFRQNLLGRCPSHRTRLVAPPDVTTVAGDRHHRRNQQGAPTPGRPLISCPHGRGVGSQIILRVASDPCFPTISGRSVTTSLPDVRYRAGRSMCSDHSCVLLTTNGKRSWAMAGRRQALASQNVARHRNHHPLTTHRTQS